jgi:hypothetical protein
MSTATLTKENSVQILINSVKLAQTKGCFLLQECALIKKAFDFFDKNVKEKPTFGESQEDPKVICCNLLLQSVQKANSSPNNPFSIEDAALLFQVFEFLAKEMGPEVTPKSNETSGSSTKAKASKSLRDSVVVDEEEDTPVERLISVKGKGKAF